VDAPSCTSPPNSRSSSASATGSESSANRALAEWVEGEDIAADRILAAMFGYRDDAPIAVAIETAAETAAEETP
jgi:hypothetical protein